MSGDRKPMRLAHAWPKMAEDQAARIDSCLSQGCWCGSEKASLRLRKNASGIINIGLQCDGCGRNVTGSLPRLGHPHWASYPAWDDALLARVDEIREEQSRAWAEKRQVQSEAWWQAYSEDLDSPEWRRLRDAVIRRANGRCEACFSALATDGHHTAYASDRPFWRVPAWEIRAVCRPCHDRLHGDWRYRQRITCT